MHGVFSFKRAVLLHFQPIGIVFLFLHRVVVALLAFGAGKCDLYSHNGSSFFDWPPSRKNRAQKKDPAREVNILYHNATRPSSIFFASRGIFMKSGKSQDFARKFENALVRKRFMFYNRYSFSRCGLYHIYKEGSL